MVRNNLDDFLQQYDILDDDDNKRRESDILNGRVVLVVQGDCVQC